MKLEGDGRKHQDLPHSPPPPRFLTIFMLHIVVIFPSGKTNEYMASGEWEQRENRRLTFEKIMGFVLE